MSKLVSNISDIRKMLINQLKLVNFRNYSKYNISFSPVTVITGYNGIGKSNILEAISMLSYAKSYRTHDERNLIKYSQNYAQIKADLAEHTKINFVISLIEGKIKKQVKINKIDQKLSNLIGKIKIVLFTPESLDIITSSPSCRRKFLNICLSQIDKQYLQNLIELKKILKQRNQLLKLIFSKNACLDQLDFWNKKLSEASYYIIKKRIDLISFFKKDIQAYYDKISGGTKDRINILYQSKIEDIDKIDQYISLYQEREIQTQKTLIGPHLDNIKILINKKPAIDIASRGEIRSLVLCLKLLEIKFLEENNKNKKVLLLLDDIFSELDKNRREQVIKIIKDRQTIITATDKEFVKKNLNDVKIINLEKICKN